MVISTWDSVEDWNKWAHSQERARMDQKMETLTGEKQNIIYTQQWSPVQLMKKSRINKLNTVLTVNEFLNKMSLCLLRLSSTRASNFWFDMRVNSNLEI